MQGGSLTFLFVVEGAPTPRSAEGEKKSFQEQLGGSKADILKG
jgi:hypothetical protein